MNKFTLLLVFFFLCNFLGAQSIGGFSAKLKWNSLKSEKSTIIFNPAFRTSAFQVQGIIQRLEKTPFNIGKKVKDIQIVLRTNSSLSNGYVGIAPFKSEFYLNPSQDNFALGSLPWTYLLSVHEYQHVLQFSNTLYGPTKLAYLFGGDLAWGAIINLTIPNWFFEGDAVRAETEYSNQGRGRIPYFLNGFRQMAYFNSNYSYAKLRNGSFKDNVPNHYPLGYLMIKYGKEKYGNEFWSTVLKETAQFKGIFYPFSKALKRNSGLNAKNFYKESLTKFQKDLNPDTKLITYDGYVGRTIKEIKANKSIHFYQQDPETFEHYISASSFNEPTKIEHVFTSLKREKTHLQGIRHSNYFDVINNKIVYSAKFVHPRWNLKDYSDIVIYDIENKKLKRITRHKRIFSPSFINKGEQLVAIEMDEILYPNIVIYNLNGQTVNVFENKEGYYFNYPKEISKNDIVVGLRDSLGRTNISIYDIKNQTHEILLPWTYHQIGIPEYSNGFIYYAASYSGIDHIYRVNIKSKEINQVTFGKNSHYQVYVNAFQNRVYFQVYNLNGNQIQYQLIDSIKSIPYIINPLKKVIPVEFAEEENLIQVYSEAQNTTIEKYSKTKHLFNFHSWTLNSIDPEYELSLLSENILETFYSRVGGTYNRNENGIGYFANISYSQLFPVFSLTFSNEKRSSFTGNNSRYFWNQTELISSISIPLDFSSKSFYKKVNFGISHSFSKVNYESDAISDIHLNTIQGNISSKISRLKARKNIFTHLGWYSNWSYENSLYHQDLSLLGLKNAIALPGIFINHNLIIYGDFQISKNQTHFNYSDNFNYARGYQINSFTSDAYRLGFNYHFPLLYPDKGALGLIYILRTRMNLFFDYSKITSNKNNSIGAEVIFDISLFNTFNTSLGFRTSHLLNLKNSNSGNLKYELFIPLNRF